MNIVSAGRGECHTVRGEKQSTCRVCKTIFTIYRIILLQSILVEFYSPPPWPVCAGCICRAVVVQNCRTSTAIWGAHPTNFRVSPQRQRGGRAAPLTGDLLKRRVYRDDNTLHRFADINRILRHQVGFSMLSRGQHTLQRFVPKAVRFRGRGRQPTTWRTYSLNSE